MGDLAGSRGVRRAQCLGAVPEGARRPGDRGADYGRLVPTGAARTRTLGGGGAFGVRALTQAAALELREEEIHVALLIVDAGIDRSGEGDARTADQPSLADAVAYLASQSPRAMTHELQVTPALDNWTP